MHVCNVIACHPTRAAAYLSSRHLAFELEISSSAQSNILEDKNSVQPPPTDDATSADLLHDAKRVALMADPEFESILKATSHRENSDWLTSNARYVATPYFELAVMPRLGISHPNLPKHVRCPGCEATFNSKDILTHIPGCVRCSGFNATSKHNALVRFLHEMCLKAGIPCEREQRSLSTWTCLTCRSIVNISNEPWHHKVCPGKHLHRSGPDLVIYWNTGPVF